MKYLDTELLEVLLNVKEILKTGTIKSTCIEIGYSLNVGR
jgi:hypothetical protein